VRRYVSETLADHHKLDRFDSGSGALDGWLHDHARHAQAMRTARSFVWHGGDRVVVAYFSLASHLVVRAELPAKIGRGSPDAIPAVLLVGLCSYAYVILHDIEGYEHLVRLWTVVLEISVMMAQFPSKAIAERSTTAITPASLAALMACFSARENPMPPKLIETTSAPSSRYMSGVSRACPLLRPRWCRTSTGTPINLPPKRPRVRCISRTCKRPKALNSAQNGDDAGGGGLATSRS
jgi:hypothetical protein